MGIETWVLVATGFGAFVLLLVVILLVRWCKRLPPLTLHFSNPTLKPVSGRPEWFMDVVAEFANNTSHAIMVGGVRSLASAPDKYLLEAKRILGTEAAHFRHGSHPPDIALRLPVEVPPNTPVDYRFHVFFSGRIRPLWHNGLFQLFAIGMDGTVAEGRCSLSPPAEDVVAR